MRAVLCVYARAHVCAHMLCECGYTGVMCGLHVEVREQLCEIAPLSLPLHGFWDSQALRQILTC